MKNRGGGRESPNRKQSALRVSALSFSRPYLVTSLLPYLSRRIARLLLHCSTHGSPTTRPTLPRRSPLARRDRTRHSRLPALHCARRRRRAFLASPDSSGSALLDRNWFRAR